MSAVTADLSPTFSLPRHAGTAAVLAIAYLVVPFIGTSYLFEAILLPFLALSLAGVGLNLLTAMRVRCRLVRLHSWPSVPSRPIISICGSMGCRLSVRSCSVVFPPQPLASSWLAEPATACFYLAVSTLAAQFFVQWALTKFSWFSNDSASGVIDAPALSLAGFPSKGRSGVISSR